MDLVVNHTSDEHSWFLKSRSSTENTYREYYIWRPGNNDEPPNNWESVFGGSAWTYDEATDEYYLHLFDEKQPDLNWENPAVREDIYTIIRWWLEKGVDGFRMDVINLLSKSKGLPDGDPESWLPGIEHFVDGPEIHDYLREMNQEVLADRDVMTVGEMYTTLEEALQYLEPGDQGLEMIFHFEHMYLDRGTSLWNVVEWQLTDFKEVLTKWQTALYKDGWNALYLSNHDQPRQVSRFGNNGEYRVESAKLLATLLHTLRGTPYIYQGEELGMTNVRFDRLDDYRDVDTIQRVERAIEQGKIDGFSEIADLVHARSRDNARTPMQWTDESNAGFTDSEPWIQVNPNYPEINAEQAIANSDSVWNYYRRLIALRKEYSVMIYGEYKLLLPDHEQIYAYTRTLGDEQLLVILNFSGGASSFELPDQISYEDSEVLIGNYNKRVSEPPDAVDLRPYEAQVYRLM